MRKHRWKILVGAVVLCLATISLGLTFLIKALPVYPSVSGGRLILKSDSDTLWIAHIAAGGVETTVEIPARKSVEVPIDPAGGFIGIELFRASASKPSWTIQYEAVYASAGVKGFDAGARYSVEATLSELLGLGNR